jgi:hypothetical protein
MPTTVTSHFYEQMISTNPRSIIFSFTFAGSEFNSRVVKYDNISRTTNDIFGGDFSVELENASGIFSNMLTDRVNLKASCVFQFGFKTSTGSDDLMQLFEGDLKEPRFNKDIVEFSFRDKLDNLARGKVGTAETAVSFTNTSVNPADLAWWLVTSYGNLSAVQSTSNPDIDYAAWQTYWNQFDNSNILVNAHFTGDTVSEGLEAIRNITDSIIYAEKDNKLVFNRWSGAAASNTTLTDSWLIDVSAYFDYDRTLNTVTVPFGYSTSLDLWTGQVTWANTSSVVSYGTYDTTYDDTSVWYTNSATALTLAQRIVYRLGQPPLIVEGMTPLPLLNARLGDEYTITSSAVQGISNLFLSLASYNIDIEDVTIDIELNESIKLQGFVLDDDYWGLLDQTYNPLVG